MQKPNPDSLEFLSTTIVLADRSGGEPEGTSELDDASANCDRNRLRAVASA